MGDEKQIQGNSRRVVSPSSSMTLAQYPFEVLFKLVVQPYGARLFERSRGGSIKVKCESDTAGMTQAAEMQFTIQVGGETRGPFVHDFSSQALGEVPPRQDVWNLKAAVNI